MELTVNGELRQVGESVTLADLVAAAGAPERGSAVAVDGVVVPRSEWPTRRLESGARIELVHAVQGG
jgi:sulfur carrier protein